MTLPTQPLPRALLLDIGGVIIDIDPTACFDSWAQACGADAERIAARWGIDDAYKAFEVGSIDFDAYIEHLARRLRIRLSREQWLEGWNALLREPVAPVVALLEEIGSSIPLYAFSNTNPVHEAVWQPRLASTLASFRAVYTSCQIGHRKPDVESYIAVVNLMGTAPADILFIDDNPENVHGARTAGIDARLTGSPAETLALLKERALDRPGASSAPRGGRTTRA